MEIKRGIPVSPGVVIKRAFVLDSEDVRIPRRHFVDTDAGGEIARLKTAVLAARDEIVATREKEIGRAHV